MSNCFRTCLKMWRGGPCPLSCALGRGSFKVLCIEWCKESGSQDNSFKAASLMRKGAWPRRSPSRPRTAKDSCSLSFSKKKCTFMAHDATYWARGAHAFASKFPRQSYFELGAGLEISPMSSCLLLPWDEHWESR